MKREFILIILFFLFVSCSSNSLKKDYKQLKSKVVTIPNYTDVIVEGRDTIVEDLLQGKLKLIVFSDSTSCNSCSIETIYKWKPLIEYAKKYDDWLCYYFIYTPRKDDIDKVRLSLNMTRFNYPMILDYLGEFKKLNPHVPSNKMFHTFLLDEDNNVVMVGNPLRDTKTEELFKTTVEKLLE